MSAGSGTDVLEPGSGGEEVVGVTLGSVVFVVDGLVMAVVVMVELVKLVELVELVEVVKLVVLEHDAASNKSSRGAMSAWRRLIMDLTPTT